MHFVGKNYHSEIFTYLFYFYKTKKEINSQQFLNFENKAYFSLRPIYFNETYLTNNSKTNKGVICLICFRSRFFLYNFSLGMKFSVKFIIKELNVDMQIFFSFYSSIYGIKWHIGVRQRFFCNNWFPHLFVIKISDNMKEKLSF